MDCEQEASPAVFLYLQSQKEGTEDLSVSEFSRINIMNENFGSGENQFALSKIDRQNLVNNFNIFCTHNSVDEMPFYATLLPLIL